MRPSGLDAGIDKDRPDYTVCTGEWEVGRIYQTRGGPENMRWFWSDGRHGPMARANGLATREEAKVGVVSDPGASSASIDLRSRRKK